MSIISNVILLVTFTCICFRLTIGTELSDHASIDKIKAELHSVEIRLRRALHCHDPTAFHQAQQEVVNSLERLISNKWFSKQMKQRSFEFKYEKILYALEQLEGHSAAEEKASPLSVNDQSLNKWISHLGKDLAIILESLNRTKAPKISTDLKGHIRNFVYSHRLLTILARNLNIVQAQSQRNTLSKISARLRNVRKDYAANKDLADMLNMAEWNLIDEEIERGTELSSEDKKRFFTKIPILDKTIINFIGEVVIIGFGGKCMVFTENGKIHLNNYFLHICRK